MTATVEALRQAPPVIQPPAQVTQEPIAPLAAPVAKRKLPFSPKTAVAVAVAIAIATAGGVYIALPKPSETTNAAYVQADSSTVSPRVRGLVAEVLVQHNEAVRAGQPLVRIDPEEFNAREAECAGGRARCESGVCAA
jgi:membrane fusion protein (multidrug efflux system)